MKNNPHVVIDCESDGPVLGIHSMICFGAVIVEKGLKRSFYGQLKPISPTYVPEALAVSGFAREETEAFPAPEETLKRFVEWLRENIDGRPIFWSDNNQFDGSTMNWYLHTYLGENPFGWSSRRIGDFICGLELNPRFNWKRAYRWGSPYKHDHNPENDAKGNAWALLSACDKHKIKL